MSAVTSFQSMTNERTRLLPLVPLARAAFAREIDHDVAWFDAERSLSRL